MKILVLSLLRVGDVILSAPVLRGLRDRYPDAEIDLLVNQASLKIAGLLPYVDRFIGFEREQIQYALGSPDVPVFESYERLSGLLDELNSEKYDLTINITHNRLSGWVMSLIDAKQRIGLCFDAGGKVSFGSNWFRYLNNQVDSEGPDVFHFTDVFRFALGLENITGVESGQVLEETKDGQLEAAAFLARIGCKHTDQILAVQPLTSDGKKDWGFDKFADSLVTFRSLYPNAVVVVLGAPFETDLLSPFVERLSARGVSAHLGILSFAGAFSLLKRARLLLTGDTSIKHLSCAARTPVVELSLGSSDYFRTGAYLHGSVILQSKEPCAPCVHSKACHQKTHACADRMPADVVAMTVSEVFAGRSFQLRFIAEEYQAEVDILRVETKASGFWAACNVLERFSEENVGHWVDRLGRKLWLQRSPQKQLEMGSEIRKLAVLLKGLYPTVSPIEWRHLLDAFDHQASSIEGRVNSFKTGIRILNGSYEDPRKLRDFVKSLIAFRERIRHLPSLRSFKSSLDSVIEDDISPAFTRFRRIVDSVSEIEQRTTINLRVIRGLVFELDRQEGLGKV